MLPPPRRHHRVAYILRVAERRGPAGPHVGADVAALAAVAHRVVRSGAGMPRRQIPRHVVMNDLLGGTRHQSNFRLILPHRQGKQSSSIRDLLPV